MSCKHVKKVEWPTEGKHWPGEDIGPEYCPKRAKRQALELLDCWVKNIEHDCGLKRDDPDICSGCFPEFTCLESIYHKKPFCHKLEVKPLITNIPTKETRYVSERKNVTDSNPRVENILVGYNLQERPVPVWERPRVHSKLFIGGRWRTINDCFKKNGLSDDWCPRTKSCQMYENFYDLIQTDYKEHGGDKHNQPEQIEGCCCPGESSKLPYVTCVSCGPSPPKAAGYLGFDIKPRPRECCLRRLEKQRQARALEQKGRGVQSKH